MKHIVPLFFVGALLALPGCTAVATGLGASAGIAAAQEGGLSRAVSDAAIQIQINDLWFRHDVDMFRKLDMTVKQGRVLITGVVQDPEHRVEAVRLAWQPKGVKQVINEIRVADSKGIVGFAKDSWISARLRSALIFDKHIQSINYNIDTVQGTVYLMGFALSQAELNRVIEKARVIPHVKRVVSYVKIVGADSDSATPYDAPANGTQQNGYAVQKNSVSADPWREGSAPADRPMQIAPPADSAGAPPQYQNIETQELGADDWR